VFKQKNKVSVSLLINIGESVEPNEYQMESMVKSKHIANCKNQTVC